MNDGVMQGCMCVHAVDNRVREAAVRTPRSCEGPAFALEPGLPLWLIPCDRRFVSPTPKGGSPLESDPVREAVNKLGYLPSDRLPSPNFRIAF